MTTRTLMILPDPEALAQAAAVRFMALAAAAIDARGVAQVALAGGRTPRLLYQCLAVAPLARVLDWSRVELWFTDERAVAPDHPESNYRMVRETLLDGLSPLGPRVRRMQGEGADLPWVAAEYAADLRRALPAGPDGRPVLDLVLLGLGSDGHTASLFPGTAILAEQGDVGLVYVPRLGSWRLSLTFGVLNAARAVLFLVSGTDKADVIGQVLGGTPVDEPLPAGRIAPAGRLEWYLDAAAAANLDAARGVLGAAGGSWGD